MEGFLTLIAWVFAILSTVTTILISFTAYTYDEVDRLRDRMRGVRVKFNILPYALVMIISWCWIIAV
jgi:hypothetical protein